MSESRAMIVRAGGDPSRLIVVNRPTRRVVSSGIPGAGGADGRSITSVDIDGSDHLIITYSDATTSDAGLLPGSASWGGITGTLADQTDLIAALDGKATSAQGALADSAVQPGDLAAVATSGDYDDLANKPTLGTAAATNSTAYATAAQGGTADSAVQPAALTSALAGKVDVDGAKVLSDENYTSAEKSKLAGLESSHWRGLYASLVALEVAHPTASAGDYADVDAGTGFDTARHLWDADDAEWIPSGSGAPLTAADVKSLYESNADTNAYTDTEKTKLAGVATGATVNANTDSLSEGSTNKWFTESRVRAALATGLSFADSTVIAATDSFLQIAGKLAARLTLAFDRANHTGSQAISTVTGLQAALDKALYAPPINETTTARSLAVADSGAFIHFTNASDSTCTVTPQASEAWPDAVELSLYRDAAGTLTIVAGAGVTVKPGSGGTLVLTDGMAVTLKRVALNSWLVIGQTVPA